MKYLSVCSGIEAASVAWHPLGWKPVAFSEIEPFPCAVLKHHYPDVPNYGDMTKYKEWPDATIDVLVGGTPCQSFSVAGLRAGLADPRGNLMLTFGAIADKYRTTWLVWENVPGVLSSNGGKDFGTFLGMLAELGYGFSYRVLDAQYVRTQRHPRAVPQRRRRVFVVGHLGDWRRAAAVLFERESLSGNTAPNREKGERVAPSVACGPPFSRTGNERVECEAMIPSWWDGDPQFTLQAAHSHAVAFDARQYPVYDHNVSMPLGRNDTGHGVFNKMQVRRLTPKECARLQAFPDDYLGITYNGKPATDGHKYKALGNSMAVNVMEWIGHRIQKISDMRRTN